MKLSGRQRADKDFLSSPFVALPYELLTKYASLGVPADEMMMLIQILASGQINGTTELSPKDVGDLCGMSSKEVMQSVERLIHDGYLAIGERFDDSGAHVTYFDLQPLWDRVRGKPQKMDAREWRRDPMSMFEEEFGRPLSAMECDQLRTWLGTDGYPEWMIAEALRESVLANKYSFRYIDRVLFDWQRNQIKSRQDLDTYRQQYRDRVRDSDRERRPTAARSTTAPSSPKAPGRAQRGKEPERDERYANFYQLFPEG